MAIVVSHIAPDFETLARQVTRQAKLADLIELRHNAKSRRGFALGALAAARWLRGRKGIYTMDDVEL